MTSIVFVVAGIVGVVGGALLVNRLRRWQPQIRPELGEYDPGPDAIDWLEALGLLAAGLALVALALIA